MSDQPQSLGDTGRWVVTTSSGSVYEIDMDARCVVRVPDSGSGSVPMRRDGGAVRLIAVERCVVGEPAVLHLDGVAEPEPEVVSTTRVTTPVVSIQPVRRVGLKPPLE